MRASKGHWRQSGFSLVEITLALGIVTVGIVAMLGILSASMTSNTDSTRDTVMASMSRRLLGDLRAFPFDDLWSATPWDPKDLPKNRTTMSPVANDTRYFFKRDGSLLQDSLGRPLGAQAAQNDPGAFYECLVKKTPDPATRPKPHAAKMPAPFNLLNIELRFSWPGARDHEVQTLHATIARY